MPTAVIAFGGNLDRPAEHVRRAIAAVAALPQVRRLHASSLYRTAPVGYTDQPDFINAVALIDTDYTPAELLHQLQQIEQDFGRTRSFRNAPRTLDLDIIDFEHTVQNQTELQLPHPRARERGFVLKPLAEIAPDYRFADAPATAVSELAAALPDNGIERLQAA